MAATDLFAGTDRHAQYNAGGRIFGRGQYDPLMDAILEGAVDIVLKGRHSETVGVGCTFGEMALIDDEPQVKARVAKTDRDSFLARVQLSPEFALAGTF
jgi:CRP-like cAMP-binding protein